MIRTLCKFRDFVHCWRWNMFFTLNISVDGCLWFSDGLQWKNLFQVIKPLSANPTEWSNTLKQSVGNLLTNCLSVFDPFVGWSFWLFLQQSRFSCSSKAELLSILDSQELFRMTALYRIFINIRPCIRKRTKKKWHWLALALKRFFISLCKTLTGFFFDV